MTPPFAVFSHTGSKGTSKPDVPLLLFLLYCNWLAEPAVQSMGSGIVTGCCAATVRVTSG